MARRSTAGRRRGSEGEDTVAATVPAAAGVKKRRKPSPFLGGILPLDTARIPMDVAAGATLAALAIPEVMGYTKIAGTPVVTGLYTLLLPVLFFALFGSSRHLVVGADSATAAILAIGLGGMAAADSSQYVALASLAALMCGLLLFGARLLKLGFISNFLSRSVLVGFLTGVGIQVAMGQVAGMFGVPKGSGGEIESLAGTLQNIAAGQTSVPTLVVSLSVLIVVVGLERVNKRIPGALIAVVGAIVASYALDLVAKGVTTLGTVPGGLPPIGLPTSVMTLENVQALLPTVISLFVVILAQSAATSQAYAARYGDSFNENVDLIGLGLANIGAGVSGTFVVNGSPTKTEMVDSAGGRSQVAQLTAGAIVLVVLLFLTGPLSYMPNAVLSAVVFLIGIKLIDYKHMAAIMRLRPDEFAVAAITAAVVVIVGVEQGIFLAMGLSVLVHLWHSYRPYNALLSVKSTGSLVYGALAEHVQAAPGLYIYQFGAGLFYANASRFNEEVLGLVEEADPPVRWFCVAGAAMADIDYTGAEALRSMAKELKERGATLALCRLTPKVRDELAAYGLLTEIGEAMVFEDANAVLAAYTAAPAAGSAG
jgi:sulfate permease, SulP family